MVEHTPLEYGFGIQEYSTDSLLSNRQPEATGDIGAMSGNITTLLSSALASYSVESAIQIIGTYQTVLHIKRIYHIHSRTSCMYVVAGATASVLNGEGSGCSGTSDSACASLRGDLISALASSQRLQVRKHLLQTWSDGYRRALDYVSDKDWFLWTGKPHTVIDGHVIHRTRPRAR